MNNQINNFGQEDCADQSFGSIAKFVNQGSLLM